MKKRVIRTHVADTRGRIYIYNRDFKFRFFSREFFLVNLKTRN